MFQYLFQWVIYSCSFNRLLVWFKLYLTFYIIVFKVTIQSRNEKGVSTQSPTVALGYSSEAMPTVSPPAPTVINSTVQGVHLKLKIIEANQVADIKGFFRGYRIEWCDASLDPVKCDALRQFKVSKTIYI